MRLMLLAKKENCSWIIQGNFFLLVDVFSNMFSNLCSETTIVTTVGIVTNVVCCLYTKQKLYCIWSYCFSHQPSEVNTVIICIIISIRKWLARGDIAVSQLISGWAYRWIFTKSSYPLTCSKQYIMIAPLQRQPIFFALKK